MASRDAWSDRSGSDKRKLLGRFGVLYLLICLVGLVLGWPLVAVIFGLGALGLGIAWFVTSGDTVEEPEPRARPEWMQAMDDPNAPDLTLPEYRDGAPSEAETSGASIDPSELPTTPPEAPPHPTI